MIFAIHATFGDITTSVTAAWFNPCLKKAINKHCFSWAHGVCHTRLGRKKKKQIDSLQYWNILCQRSPPGKDSAWMLVILLLQTASSGRRTARECLHTLGWSTETVSWSKPPEQGQLFGYFIMFPSDAPKIQQLEDHSDSLKSLHSLKWTSFTEC